VFRGVFVYDRKGGTDYGWVRLEFSTGPNQVAQSITALDWAHTNGSITNRKQRSAGTVNVAMALLAAGAAGVGAPRRRKIL
jgi:hypothetical protein